MNQHVFAAILLGLLGFLLGFLVACGEAISSPDDQQAQELVAAAIAKYQEEGLETTIAHYNSPASLDGQWYVFMGDPATLRNIAHPLPEFRYTHAREAVDSTGYRFGLDIMAAPAEGKWYTYEYTNPATGAIEPKRSWAQSYDGLIFGAGYYASE